MIITTLASYKYNKEGSEIKMTLFAEDKRDIIARVTWKDKNNTQELAYGVLTFNTFSETKYNIKKKRAERIQDVVKLNIECILQHILNEEIFTCSFIDTIL